MNIARAIVFVCVAAACGCGSPGDPTPPALNLAGNWTGSWTFPSGGATVSDAVTMTVTQTGTSAGGQWTATGGAAGTVSFTAAENFTGTATISQTLLTGVNCSARRPASEPWSPASGAWTGERR